MAKGVKNEKKHRFVVGYQAGSNNTVWGQLAFLNNSDDRYRDEDYCHLMTEKQARKALKGLMVYSDAQPTLFELVPQKIKGADENEN
ncbi:hypothetical protein LCGC14_1760710 [marine sediment metagenome]|uniref:Uncharacterized protein n=1 Tax=marine sediment metagenome TaxID=412755 RepID=A0A0F9K0T2_9ZZZZ